MTNAPWHQWFAWYPVRTNYHGWKWLRTVYRRQRHTPQIPFHGPHPYWEYDTGAGNYIKKVFEHERGEIMPGKIIYAPHRCFGYPDPAPIRPGTIWQCDECNTKWVVVSGQGEDGRGYDAWRELNSRNQNGEDLF